MIKYVFFDFDGVLVDTKDAHYTLLNSALLSMDYDIIQYNDHITTYDGLPTTKKLQILVNTNKIRECDVTVILNKKQNLTEEYVQKFVKIPNSIVESITKISLNYRTAITSNCSRKTIDSVLSKLSVPIFDYVVSKDDVVNPKPSTDMYIKAQSFFNASPAECVIIDDLHHAEIAAISCGMHFIKINNMYIDMNYENIYNKIKEVL